MNVVDPTVDARREPRARVRQLLRSERRSRGVVMRWVRILIWNTIAGLLTLFLANLLWKDVGYPWWGLVLTALGGVPGAILVVLLRLLAHL